MVWARRQLQGENKRFFFIGSPSVANLRPVRRRVSGAPAGSPGEAMLAGCRQEVRSSRAFWSSLVRSGYGCNGYLVTSVFWLPMVWIWMQIRNIAMSALPEGRDLSLSITGDLPSARPSYITRVFGVEIGRFRVGRARRARSPQFAQAPCTLLPGSGCRARHAA